MSVFNLLNAALYNRLAGTALTTLLAGGTAGPFGGTAGPAVYYEQAPDDAPLPYVVYSYQAGPTEPQRTRHRDPEALVFARAYAASAAQAGTIDAAIDGLLHGKPLSVSGYSNYWIGRERSLSSVEIDAALQKTWMVGALYDVRLDKTPTP